MSSSYQLLNEQEVLKHLVERGIVPEGPMFAVLLGGGVSNVVYECKGEGWKLVVKQALERLRVESEWLAPQTHLGARSLPNHRGERGNYQQYCGRTE
jgi:hypothetical protein